MIEKNWTYKNFAKLKCSGVSNSESDLETFNTLQNRLTSLIAEPRKIYYPKIARKSADSCISETLTGLF